MILRRSARFLLVIVLIASTVAYVRTAPSEAEIVNPHPVPAFTVKSFAGIKDKLTFLVVGDWGTGDQNQKLIARRMGEKAAADGAQCVIMTGDNFYPTGVSSVTDKQWTEKWRNVYTAPSLQIPFYVCLGNHDYIDNPKAEVEYTAHDPRWKMPERHFTFVEPVSSATTVEFFALDTTPININMKDSIAVQVAWLEEQLKNSTARWKIVFGHHPVYSNGLHGNTKTMLAHFQPLFEKYHVDLYLCGHDHDIQVLQPVNGVHYIVSGGGGGWRDVKWGANTIYANTNLGFVWCAVTDTLLEAQCLDRTGAVKFAYDIAKSK